MTGILYTVATPIGNLEDITQRALKTLESVDYILCEDTRVSSKLLSHFDIHNKLVAYHKFNEQEQVQKIMEDIKSGKNIALISDAGTPCISDPGRILVNKLFEENLKVVPISGCCAISTFLSAVSKNDEEYAFIGFLPRTSSEQTEILNKFKNIDLVFYESPNRLIKTLEIISKIRGNNTKIAIGRELTKIYEEIKVDTVENIISHYTTNPLKGEIVVMLYKIAEKELDPEEILKKITILKSKNYSSKDISIIISSLFDINKNKVYKLVSE